MRNNLKNVRNIWGGLFGIYGSLLVLTLFAASVICIALGHSWTNWVSISGAFISTWMTADVYRKYRTLLRFSKDSNVPFEMVTANYYLSMEFYWAQLLLLKPSTWSQSSFEDQARKWSSNTAKETDAQ